MVPPGVEPIIREMRRGYIRFFEPLGLTASCKMPILQIFHSSLFFSVHALLPILNVLAQFELHADVIRIVALKLFGYWNARLAAEAFDQQRQV